MLIDLKQLVQKYNLRIKGVLHIGAHQLEEKDIYKSLSIDKVIWFEANHELVYYIKSKFPNEVIYPFAICDEDNCSKEFIVTNNYQSSSLLELNTHKIEHPWVVEMKRIHVQTKRLDSFVKEFNIDMSCYNFLNMDIQGAELLALKGSSDTLKNIDYVYLEVNEKELYTGCGLLSEVDEYLKEKGFTRVEINMTPHGWGDAFYTRT